MTGTKRDVSQSKPSRESIMMMHLPNRRRMDIWAFIIRSVPSSLPSRMLHRHQGYPSDSHIENAFFRLLSWSPTITSRCTHRTHHEIPVRP